jgi:WD domain, G-beta repeat
VRLWDVETAKELRCFKGFRGVASVAFSPDGKRALSGSEDKTVRLWDVETGKEVRCFVSFRHVCKNLIRQCRAERGTGSRWGRRTGGRGGNAVRRLARAEAASGAAGYRPVVAWARLRSD